MQNRRGFSLVETIAAIVIVGIAVGAMMSMVSMANTMRAYNQERFTATLLLQKKLEEIKAMPFAAVVSETVATDSDFPGLL